MSASSSPERRLILLQLAEHIARQDPWKRKLFVTHENRKAWQITLGTYPSLRRQQPTFPTLEQALEDFVRHWRKSYTPE